MDFLSGPGEPSNPPATRSTAPRPTSTASTKPPGKKAIPIHQCDGIPECCPGLEQRANKVQEILTRVPVVGIVGIGGIGKSTIAKQVFNNISSQFEYTAFVDHAKDIPRPVYGMGGGLIHDVIPGKFYQNGIQVEKDRITWDDISQRKTLLVMDDVESATQLQCLPKLEMFGKGSYLIITSRKQSILNDFGKYPYEVYDVDLLEDHEAQKLFRHIAFGEEDNVPVVSHRLEEYIERVVEKCQGHPLTLEVTGCSFRSSNSDATWVWEETIEKFGKAAGLDGDPNERVQALMQVSVDGLPPEEREMFIDAATFFYRQPLEEAMAAWSTAFHNPDTAWENLLKRSLVKKVSLDKRVYGQRTIEGSEQVIKVRTGVWVPEQLRDLAKNLAKGEVVSLSDEEADKAAGILNTGFLNTIDTVNTQTQRLRLSYNFVWTGGCCIQGPPELVKYYTGQANDFIDAGKRPLQMQSLEKLEKLKYLELQNIPCKGTTRNFPKNLSFLSWNLKSRQLPEISLEGLSNLAVLKLRSASTIPKDFLQPLGHLNKLRILSLRRLGQRFMSERPECLPENFGNLSGLERLDLHDFPRLPSSFGNLSGLKRLDLYGVERLPSSFGNLSALEDLHLESGIGDLPESFGDLSSLKTLYIHIGSGLARLPRSFGRLSSLKKLAIECCWGLKTLGDSFGNLSALTDLRLRRCTNIAGLPVSFGNLSALENLQLNGCSTLRRLPTTFRRLGALKTLTIKDACLLEDLSKGFGDLPALTCLKLKGCPRLTRLPESFGRLTTLEVLELENSDLDDKWRDALETLSRIDFRQLKPLERLSNLNYTCFCALETLPENFGQLKALERLTIKKAVTLETVPESFGDLSALRYLRLEGWPRLERLPGTFGLRSPLKELCLKSCGKLVALPDDIFLPLSDLQTLEIMNCDNLQRLPESLGELASLRTLTIDCNRLQMLLENLGELSSLEVLHIKSIALKGLPETLCGLPALRILTVQLKNVWSLPERLGNLSSVEKLTILDCAELRSLPELGNMSSLEVLKISGCQNLESLPDSLGSISSLRNVSLYECPRLNTLPDGLGKPSSPRLQGARSMELGGLEERLLSLTKRQKCSPPAQMATTEGVRIQVSCCPLLDESLMQRLGWVIDPHYAASSRYGPTKWYQRKRVGESSATI